MKICIIGLGKAGLPLAAVIADAGIEVLGIDLDSKKVDRINKGVNPIDEEPGLKELIKKHGGKNLKTVLELLIRFVKKKKSDICWKLMPLHELGFIRPIKKSSLESVADCLVFLNR